MQREMVSCYPRGTSNAGWQPCEEQRTSGNFIRGRNAQEHGSIKKFVKDLLIKEKSGTLKTPKQELEEHLEKVHSDTKRHEHS